MCPTLTPARQAGTRFAYVGGMERLSYLVVGYIQRHFSCPPIHVVTGPSVEQLH